MMQFRSIRNSEIGSKAMTRPQGGGGGVLAAVFACAAFVAAAEPVDVPGGTTNKVSEYTLTTDFNLSGGTLEFDIAAGSDVAYTGTITGQGTVEKTGEGWLTFSGGESLTSESTLKATGGRLRFTNFASAGGATLVGNGGFFGNVAGHAIRIPSSTVVTGAPLNFYAEGDGTNVVVENCSRLQGMVTVYGDSLASVVQFDGQVPSDEETVYHWIAGWTGTALLTSDLNGFDYFQTIWAGGLGCLALGSDSSGLIGDVSFTRQGRLDVPGVTASIKALGAHDTVDSPMAVVLTNSAATAATLTMRKGGGNHPRYCARDGAAGTLDLCYDMTEGTGDDLSDALFQNHGLRIANGAFTAAARTVDFNRPAWHTAPAVSGRYLRLVVTNCTVGSSQFMGLLRIAEFRLTLGGRPVAWPAGTTASSSNALPGSEWHEEGLDRTAQAMIDDDMTTFWHPADFVVGDHPATNVIDMTREVAFNGYQMAAGGDPNNDKNSCPSGWTLEVGRDVDGAIVWEQVTGTWPDEVIGEASPSGRNYYMQMYESIGRYFEDCILPLNAPEGVETFQGPQFQGADFALAVDAPGSLTLADHLESVATLSGDGTLTLAHSRLFAASAAAFTGTLDVGEQGRVGGDPTVNGTLLVGNAEATETVATDALADTACVTVGPMGRIELRHANETVGGLSGSGTVNLGGGVLTLGADVASAFDGAFAGGGTLVQQAGVFTGTATASGDYTVRLAGGRWAGQLGVSGTLTLDGRLAVDASNLMPGTHTLFSFGSLGAGSEAVVASAVIRGKPVKPYRARVAIVGNAVVADVYAPLTLIIR